jgi:hypothetical protein
MNSRSLTVIIIVVTMMMWLAVGGLAGQSKASPHAASDSGMSAPQRSIPSLDIPSDGNPISAKSKNAVLSFASISSSYASFKNRAIDDCPRVESWNEPLLISLRI